MAHDDQPQVGVGPELLLGPDALGIGRAIEHGAVPGRVCQTAAHPVHQPEGGVHRELAEQEIAKDEAVAERTKAEMAAEDEKKAKLLAQKAKEDAEKAAEEAPAKAEKAEKGE